MKAQELRNLTQEELSAKIAELERSYYAARESVRAGKEKNHAHLKSLRQGVARAKTIWQQLAQKS